jgi:multicomponent K+:H+ antiporter subunit G
VSAVHTWVEVLVGLLLIASGLFSVGASLGVLRLESFFQRMHPPALAYSVATWCVALATIVYFSALEGRLSLRGWLVVILLSITMPVTTVLLARAALFRLRQAGAEVPPPLHGGLSGEEQPPP